MASAIRRDAAAPLVGPEPAPATQDSPWPPLVVSLVGPTSAGKSAVAIHLALSLGAEVVSADAYQVYRGMDIGTAKVPVDQRAGIAHHMFDILDVTDDLSVADFQRRGRHVLRSLGQRRTPAIIVGGSGLYVRALLDDLRFPGTDADVRERLEARLAGIGPSALHAELAARDPAAAAAILTTNGRRIVRALEVIELTGAPFTAALPKAGPPLIGHLSFGLAVESTELDARITRRTAAMFDQGLVEEVEGLLARGLLEGRTASRALGYSQVISLLSGEMTAEQARQGITDATRRYARRQRRWFARDPRTQWLSHEDPSSTAALIRDRLSGRARTLST